MPPKTKKWYEAMKNRKGKGSNQFIKARKLGLPDPVVSDNTKRKISESSKRFSKIYWSDESNKIKHSKVMKKAVLENPESYSSKNVCGRVKNITYKEHILKGGWELLFAKWLDENNIKWTNIVNPFTYYWNSGYHLYFPDFYIYEYDLFIEIKGYQTDRDLEKWKSVENLAIIKKREINKIKKGVYKKENLLYDKI